MTAAGVDDVVVTAPSTVAAVNGDGGGASEAAAAAPTSGDTSPVVVSTAGGKIQGDTGAAAADSGHESSTSTSPDSPSTPHHERSLTPDKAAATSDTPAADAVYQIRIVAPGAEAFELQVNNAEMIQEIHQVLLERESTCQRTCFSLRLDGQTLDNFTELRNIPGLRDGSVLHVVEEPYTVREARVHLRHVHDVSRSLQSTDAWSGIDGQSPCFVPTLQGSSAINATFEATAPEHVLPGTKDRPLQFLLPPSASKEDRQLPFVNLSISPYNPPTGQRRLKGDVLYLDVDTAEGRRMHITCSTRGFYVNASDDTAFKPTPATGNFRTPTYHSLVELLSSVSTHFKRVWGHVVRRRSEKHLFERLPTPYPVHGWLAPVQETTLPDSLRADEATQPHRVGFEEHLPGQVRDWNEELQTTAEMPRTDLTQRILRDRSVFKIHGDFVMAAVRGAVAVVEGNVMAINPADDPKTHMYIWNNIFFSLGFDVKDHYKELGGDAAAFVATSNDLQGVRAYAALEDTKVCTLGMVIVDYRGVRVTAQSIIPGILDREQEQSVVYGSVDFGKTVVSSPVYHELLEKTAAELKILPHEVYASADDDAKIVKLYSSFETKGIIGNDSRHYILDLLRTLPPDVNFLEGVELSERAKERGFPRSHPHKLASLRQELVDAFVESRYLIYIREAAFRVNQLRLKTAENAEKAAIEEPKEDEEPKKDDEEQNNEGDEETDAVELESIVEAKRLVEAGEEQNEEQARVTRDVLAHATAAVHSLRSDAFDIRFNPDCYSPIIRHGPTEDLEKQRQLVRDAADFLLEQQLPGLVGDCLRLDVSPVDGEDFTELMHIRGINVRYLGDILKLIDTNAAESWLRTLVAAELLSRVTKRILRNWLQSVPAGQVSAAIALFLNHYLGGGGGSSPVEQSGEAEKKKKGGNKGRKPGVAADRKGEWTTLTASGLWTQLRKEARSYFGYDLTTPNIDAFISTFGVQKTSLLRRICKMGGIQLALKDYGLEQARQRLLFVEDDILDVWPVVKHRRPGASDASRLFARAQHEMQNGRLREAYECVAESVNLGTSVVGALHGELSAAMRLLARLSYILGDPSDAFTQQHKAVLMSERCLGLDHAHTILEYMHLAHFAFANLYIGAALRLLYRARYLLLLAHGETHPLMAQIDGNIGVMLFAVQEFDSALRFLKSAERVQNAVGEPRRLKSALLYHMMARAHSCRGDFRAALQSEKETFVIYSKIFGEHHEKTKESGECLRHLTQQAVAFQKRVNDAAASNASAAKVTQLLPIQIQQPSLSSILEVLNVLNGIIIIQVGGGSSSSEESTVTKDETTIEEKKEETTSTGGDAVDAAKNLVEDALD